MIGAQSSNEQMEKILSYVISEEGRRQDPDPAAPAGCIRASSDGYYIQPTIFEGNNKMRIFQGGDLRPVCR